MTKHQESVMDKLKAVTEAATPLKIRLLIECELSGKLWVYCDAKDKRTVIRLLRKHRIMNRKRIFAEGYNTRYLNPYPSFLFLEMDKGNKVKRLQRVRTCESMHGDRGGRYFYDIDLHTIQELKGIEYECTNLDFSALESMVSANYPEITVNYSGDDIMFYGR